MKIAAEFQGRRWTETKPVLDRNDSFSAPDGIYIPDGDASLLDAYSQTVSGVVENARESVVNIRVRSIRATAATNPAKAAARDSSSPRTVTS